MKIKQLRVVRIGNSRGVRLPAELLRRYRIGDAVRVETLPDGIVLRPARGQKVSWEETYRQMAAAKEDWSAWETVTADGLMKIERYGVYLADLDPTRGSEIAKTRPVVVVSDDLMNARLETVVVCPLTTQLHPAWRGRIQITCAGRPAEIAVDQIRTISRTRLLKRLDDLNARAAAELRRLITEMYGT